MGKIDNSMVGDYYIGQFYQSIFVSGFHLVLRTTFCAISYS